MMILSAILAAASIQAGGIAVNSTSPPPVIVAVPTVAPTPIMAMPPDLASAPTVYNVRVSVVIGKRLLLDDVFRLTRNSGASFTQTRSEAPAKMCPTNRYYGYGDRQSLNLQLSLRDDPQSGPAVSVKATWQRPFPTVECQYEASRTVSLAETVPLAPGQTRSLHGDGDLWITVTQK